MSTTYEEARRCPKCDQPGESRRKDPAPDLPPGTKVHTVYCVNERCKWFDTCWFVQVNPDGSVPPPQDHRGRPKKYERFEGHNEMALRIQAAVRQQRLAEISGEGEVQK